MNIDTILHNAQKLFLNPSELYTYDAIILGTKVCGKTKVQKAVGKNTFRGFYRKAGFNRGASAIFDPFFITNKTKILSKLRKISTREEMDQFSNTLREEIKKQLINVEERQLESYNKTRKPIDLYIEHIVAMAAELSSSDRARLMPTLFLPLDSWIFGADQIFTETELRAHHLTRRSTYKDVLDRGIYMELHEMTRKKAHDISSCFYPIYFDLIWSDRYLRTNARNLFESNP